MHLGPHILPAPPAPPLKVVGVKGLNPTGSVFVAQQLVTHVPAAPRQRQEAPQECGGGMSMVVAAGPFTTSDNVQYEPLEELLNFCTGELYLGSLSMKVTAGEVAGDKWENMEYMPMSCLLVYPVENNVGEVVLMGPFVDVEHPSVKDGSLDVTFEQLFREQVRGALEGTWEDRGPCDIPHVPHGSNDVPHGSDIFLCQSQVLSKVLSWQNDSDNLTRRVLLMPAVRDATSTPAFPQPPFALRGVALPGDLSGGERLRSLQNPSSFVVPPAGSNSSSGGVTVSACSQDVLMHLSAGEVSRGVTGQDRMQALASHVVGQRR